MIACIEIDAVVGRCQKSKHPARKNIWRLYRNNWNWEDKRYEIAEIPTHITQQSKCTRVKLCSMKVPRLPLTNHWQSIEVICRSLKYSVGYKLSAGAHKSSTEIMRLTNWELVSYYCNMPTIQFFSQKSIFACEFLLAMQNFVKYKQPHTHIVMQNIMKNPMENAIIKILSRHTINNQMPLCMKLSARLPTKKN